MRPDQATRLRKMQMTNPTASSRSDPRIAMRAACTPAAVVRFGPLVLLPLPPLALCSLVDHFVVALIAALFREAEEREAPASGARHTSSGVPKADQVKVSVRHDGARQAEARHAVTAAREIAASHTGRHHV